MRFAILTAAALSLGATAYAASTPAAPPAGWPGVNATPVAAKTCAGLAARYDTVAKAHATSPDLAKANAAAADGKTACDAGKTADGIADYETAIKLLGA
ncbi:hypothetical protein sos41_08690 [Alphaproteobacteria bacterium SO-S41]|nr:hypothetical protein sos41_08690 [Alphaproteobacteria bacterium SO-S41]